MDRSLLLTDLLSRVSRSFYLTLRVLPSVMREPIGLAYLLARASDTIADTELVPSSRRLELLRAYGNAIQSESAAAPVMKDLEKHQQDDSEAELLRVCHEAIDLLRQTPEHNRLLIQEVLGIIISGQQLDLERFHRSTGEGIISLDTSDELMDYAYRVAGCVGAFWTRVSLLHLKGNPSVPPDELERLGIRFGQGLQMVNILRDFQGDLSMGRCYLPKEKWAPTGWTPQHNNGDNPAFNSLWKDHIKLAMDCLNDGWTYTQALPSSWIRVRLSCSWPILLGIRTLQPLANPPLPQSKPAKVPRSEVYEIMLRTIVSSPFPSVWNGLYNRFLEQYQLPEHKAETSSP
jgi:farnesyl-diphosphate farnesyltransferase